MKILSIHDLATIRKKAEHNLLLREESNEKVSEKCYGLSSGAQHLQILICGGTGCKASSSQGITDNLLKAIEKNGIIRMYDPETGNVGSIVGEKGIKNDNSLFDLLFLGKGASNIFNSIFETTVHGATRVAGVSATRGGVLSKFEVIVARIGGTRMTQADGAFVYIYQKASGKFNVAVFGRNGFVTSFRNISQKSLDRLSKNYGWH